MNLTDKVALVTGGARRVGRAIALALGRAGCDIAITCRQSCDQAASLLQALGDMGRRAVAIPIDLTAADAPMVIRQALVDRLGRLDVLVHNAAHYRPTPFGAITPDDFALHMNTNAMAPLLITQGLADLLGAGEGGRIIHLLDMHLLGRSRPGYAAYNASKAALLELTYTLARELAPKITVNAIAPGVVDWAQDMTQPQRDAYLARIPLARAGTPEDAAAAALYLARDADYLTGQVITVDGGRSLR